MAESKSALELLIEQETPKMVRVIFLNDDYTTREFVIQILQSIFDKSIQEAEHITNAIHYHGTGVVGVYPYDIGETKAQETLIAAKKEQFPLKVFTESI